MLEQKEFPSDYINLTHNTGVYLYKDLLAVLSLQHQQVHLLRLTDDGELMDIKTIGEFCYEDDALFLSRTSAEGGQSDGWGAPNQEQADGTTPWSLSSILQPPEGMVFFNPHERPHQFIGGLKHLLLVFLWKRARMLQTVRRRGPDAVPFLPIALFPSSHVATRHGVFR